MSDHKTAVIVGITVFTIAAIIGVNIGGGYYLRHTKNVDVHYIYSGHVISEVLPAIELIPDDSEYVPETTITEAPKKQETKECRNREGWRKGPLQESSIQTILFYLDVALVGIGIFAYLLCLGFESGDPRKLAKLFGCFVAYLVVSGAVIIGIYNYYLNKPYTDKHEVMAPIIYLYDEQSREVSVKLKLQGELKHTYPSYVPDAGWTVKTSPDGILTDRNGRQYEYLFWDADLEFPVDFRYGFCVKGEDTSAFLEKALSDLGLSDAEANTFIMYWLPQLEAHPYNVIAFQTSTYEEAAVLDVSPAPDTIVRVNMAFFETSEYVEIKPQDLTSMNPSLEEREGLTLVEWGGEEIT